MRIQIVAQIHRQVVNTCARYALLGGQACRHERKTPTVCDRFLIQIGSTGRLRWSRISNQGSKTPVRYRVCQATREGGFAISAFGGIDAGDNAIGFRAHTVLSVR